MSAELLIGLDFETTGIDPFTDGVVQIGLAAGAMDVFRADIWCDLERHTDYAGAFAVNGFTCDRVRLCPAPWDGGRGRAELVICAHG